MKKFYYTSKKGYNLCNNISHAIDIKGDFDITIRGIIYTDKKLIYIRINDYSYAYGLEAKKTISRYNKNLKACNSFLSIKYKKFKIYNSYTINKLPINIQKEILST